MVYQLVGPSDLEPKWQQKIKIHCRIENRTIISWWRRSGSTWRKCFKNHLPIEKTATDSILHSMILKASRKFENLIFKWFISSKFTLFLLLAEILFRVKWLYKHAKVTTECASSTYEPGAHQHQKYGDQLLLFILLFIWKPSLLNRGICIRGKLH